MAFPASPPPGSEPRVLERHGLSDPHAGATPASLLSLAISFFRLGSTTFGGVWAAANVIEAELVHRRKWLKAEDLQVMLLTANLIPAPKFIGLGGLVGYRMRGWPGSIIAVLSLIAPGTILVLLAVLLIPPELLAGPLAPLRRAVGIAVVGLLFGNAYHQLKMSKVAGRARAVGMSLAALVTAATLAGLPLILAAVLGFVAGAVLIRDGEPKPGKDHGATDGRAS